MSQIIVRYYMGEGWSCQSMLELAVVEGISVNLGWWPTSSFDWLCQHTRFQEIIPKDDRLQILERRLLGEPCNQWGHWWSCYFILWSVVGAINCIGWLVEDQSRRRQWRGWTCLCCEDLLHDYKYLWCGNRVGVLLPVYNDLLYMTVSKASTLNCIGLQYSFLSPVCQTYREFLQMNRECAWWRVRHTLVNVAAQSETSV